MTIMRSVLLATILLWTSQSAFAGYTLTIEQRAVIDAWLKTHQDYRIAEDKDCLCDDDISSMRTQSEGDWKAVPDYHPYWVSGDFNGDSITDLAVVVVSTRARREFTLLVFNGPLDATHPVPAFVSPHQDMTHIGLFFGPPRPRPYRLLVGPFESEGLILEPRGKTYRLRE
jgi:hypothetical protein